MNPKRLMLARAIWLGSLAFCSQAALPAAQAQAPWQASDQGLVDPTQRLIWTRSDNGADIDWTAAGAWCASLGKDWRLPTRAELEKLTTSSPGQATPCRDARCRVPGLFTLTGYWMWSSDRDSSGRAYSHYLHTAHTQASSIDYRLNARALCVKAQ